MGKGKRNRIKPPSLNQSQGKGRIAEPSSDKILNYDDCYPVFCLRYPRHKLGAEKIARNSIKARIPQHITEDINFFISLRFSGKAPMVGYRIKDIFRIIWLDAKFTLYKH